MEAQDSSEDKSGRYFLDGFSFILPPDWEITVISESGGVEETIEIVSPEGDSVFGFFSYGPPVGIEKFKADVIAAARELFVNEGNLLLNESILAEYGELMGEIPVFWVSVKIGEEAHSVVGISLSDSPGNAQAVYFAFPPFFGLSLDEELDILADLLNSLSIIFESAAG
ncbi:MAG: hypothetical protein ACOCYA_06280 [Spirochaetota bacterium]